MRSGDTLSSITGQIYGPGDRVARQRELVAVYRANTAAFDGNMNVLRTGSRLALPGESELVAISPGEAAAEVHRQYSAWNAGHGGTLRPAVLPAPDSCAWCRRRIGAASGSRGARRRNRRRPVRPTAAASGRAAAARQRCSSASRNSNPSSPTRSGCCR